MFYFYNFRFVILHGTDTLAYTSSALSFMLESLGKPIIVTGSQIPAFETRSDGRDNLVGSLIMAGNFCIPEVSVYFNHKLMRGNRTVKVIRVYIEEPNFVLILLTLLFAKPCFYISTIDCLHACCL